MQAKAEIANVVPLPTAPDTSKAPARTIAVSPASLRAAIRAALLTFCKDETRAHLRSVAVFEREGAIELVSTDGHRLTAARTSAQAEGKETRAIALLDPDSLKVAEGAIKAAEKAARAGGTVDLVLFSDGSAEVAGVQIKAAECGPDSYPPIDQVIPTWAPQDDQKAGPFEIAANPRYVRDAMRAAEFYLGTRSTSGARLKFGGLGCELDPITVRADPADLAMGELLVIIMPMRM